MVTQVHKDAWIDLYSRTSIIRPSIIRNLDYPAWQFSFYQIRKWACPSNAHARCSCYHGNMPAYLLRMRRHHAALLFINKVGGSRRGLSIRLSGIFTYPACFWNQGVRIIEVLLYCIFSSFPTHSLGQSAVFLIGGQSKQVPPVPLLLNSGDIVIMSGSSRLAYHGVPRVLPPSHTHAVPWCLEKEQLKNCVCSRTEVRPGKTLSEFESSMTVCKGARKEDGNAINDEDITKGMNDGQFSTKDSDCALVVCSVCSQLAKSWDTFVEYLCVSRININVRQVVSEKFKFGT